MWLLTAFNTPQFSENLQKRQFQYQNHPVKAWNSNKIERLLGSDYKALNVNPSGENETHRAFQNVEKGIHVYLSFHAYHDYVVTSMLHPFQHWSQSSMQRVAGFSMQRVTIYPATLLSNGRVAFQNNAQSVA